MNTIKESGLLTREVLDAVLWVNTLFRGKVIFCGSFGLATQGLLERKISDIDCITEENWYGTFFEHIGQYGVYSSNSEKFEVDGVLVLCFKITAPNGIIVDVMFRADFAFVVNGIKSIRSYVTGRRDYEGEIRIQIAEQIIEAKRNWVKKNVLWAAPKKPWSTSSSAAKHQSDLEYIDQLLKGRKKKPVIDYPPSLEIDTPDDDIDF